MRNHAILGLYFAVCLMFGALASPWPAIAQDNEQISDDHNADVVAKIAECASQGKETVLFADKLDDHCAKYLKGVSELDARNEHTNSPEMPLQVDAAQACRNQSDKRVLPARAIKSIVNDSTKKIDAKGIRLIGAIFCDDLDLVGLDLQYSLVFDHSIFVQGIDARDFRSKGDLSFDGALLFGELRVTRAHIAGTIFGSDTLIQKTEVLDSEITGSVLFRRSLLLEPAIFDTVRISGELSLRQSAFPYFLLQFATVGGVLDLTGSQARCSYELRASKIGDLVLDGAGFGRALSADDTVATSFDWADSKVLSKLFTTANTQAPKNVADALDDRSCDYDLIAAPSVFVVSDLSVGAQLCLRNFHWLSTSTDQAESLITLNDVSVGATAFIDLTSAAVDNPPVTSKIGKRQLEILGFTAQTLIFNFDKAARQSHTSLYMNGLGFSQVYAADETSTQCGYNPDFAKPVSTINTRLVSSVGNLATLHRPAVDEVMPWLTANTAETTQPFSAFVEAFQKNGEISPARELQIKKADTELARRITRLFNVWTFVIGLVAVFGGIPWLLTRYEHLLKKAGWLCILVLLLSLVFLISFWFSSIWSVISEIWSFLTDFVGVAFGAILWLLADNGYRPEKVGWFVVIILVLFFFYFRFWERIVAIRPEKKQGSTVERKPLPIGLTFLFDRLLPAYQIREDHYKIAEYLQIVSGRQPPTAEVRYIWKYDVAPAEEATVRRVERALDIMKFLGLVLAIFLVAALNALVSH